MFNVKNLSFDAVKNDLLSGLTVSLALVPEAIAFAFVCHISPGGYDFRGLLEGFLSEWNFF